MNTDSQNNIITDDTIIEESVNVSQDITSFLNDAILKSKTLNRNKLQIELEKCLGEINDYKTNINNNKNTMDQLTRDKNTFMESNEKNKIEVQRLTQLNITLNKQSESQKISIDNEKNVNCNLKVAHEAQIQKHNTLNEQLNIKLNEHINQHNDLQLKYNDLQKRYTDLTTLYSRQTNEFELHKKNIKHLNDELNTSLSNNSLLHDEIASIKLETVNYTKQIEELKNTITLERETRETQKELYLLSLKISSDNKTRSTTIPVPGVSKSKITTNARGLRVTNR
jgi:chromosome segregation ATPase